MAAVRVGVPWPARGHTPRQVHPGAIASTAATLAAMSIGASIRKLLGPATDPVARLYRTFYIDLDDFGRTLSRFGPARRVLEVGCGDGHLTERIVREFPDAHVVGIDIADNPGQLYAGDRASVTFEQITSSELAQREPGSFDLVITNDVLHHIPAELRSGVLGDMRKLLTPDGTIVVKDWVRGRNPASIAAYMSDRYMTGDRIEFFESRDAFNDCVQTGCGPVVVVAEGRVPPRKNNIFVALRPVW